VGHADVVLPNRYVQGDRLLDMIESRRATVAAGVPTIWNDVLRCLERDPARDISSLHLILSGVRRYRSR
jgi:fatty-acyl-CoA synthase